MWRITDFPYKSAIRHTQVRELERLAIQRALPETVVSDNGTELTSGAVLRWATRRVAWHYIEPGKDSDQIVGFAAFGIEVSELVAPVQTAMVGRLPYTELRDAIFAHPTMSEGLVYLLGQVESTKG